jgi:hypothetical protein
MRVAIYLRTNARESVSSHSHEEQEAGLRA